ncbi:MAG: site-specific integrase [Muribaculaceae bacterium]|nr:site-specific integrase [Muribaculaceae bacterium]
MASIKIKFRSSSVSGREGSIFYQIIHARCVRQLLTDYKVFQSEWDERRSALITTPASLRKTTVLAIRECMRWDLERLNRICKKMDMRGIEYTSDDVVDEFQRYAREYSLFNFMESIIVRLRLDDKIRTSETYKSALNSFRTFRCGEDIMLDCMDSVVMESYESWLKKRGVAPNTISFYTRILRAVYNRAVEQEIIEKRNLFKHVYTGIDKTVKRALPLAAIKKIKVLDLTFSPVLDYARDMFLMSFYLRGMSFIDMAFLKKSDLKDGYVVYRRRKTGQRLVIEWTVEMQNLLDKYPCNETVYLLPIIRKNEINERSAYRNAGYNINHNLKKIACMAGLSIPLTLYVARHSWASAAKAKGIPVSVISEGMGHNSESTTNIYLASLDTSVVDRANQIILTSL